MARSRNIKPGFFINDDLAECDPLARILFIGLWTIADFNGNLEFKPKKIKAQLLPYDDCDVEQLTIDLDKSGLISIYTNEGFKYISVTNFDRHQNPHKNERDKGSDTPKITDSLSQVVDYKGVTINRDLNATNPDLNASDRADSLILIPDPCILIPDPVIPESLIPSKTLVEQKPDDGAEIFKYWQTTMDHPRSAYDGKRKALIRRHLKHYTVEDCKKAIHGCSVTPHNMGDNREGRVYDSFELIFRDSKHIDDYMRNSDRPPAGNIKTIEQTQSEAQAQVDRVKKHLGFDNE